MLGSINKDNDSNAVNVENSARDRDKFPEIPSIQSIPEKEPVMRGRRKVGPQEYALVLPEVVATQATKTAPSGAITTDIYRHTVFWEADECDEKSTISPTAATELDEDDVDHPFPIAWKSTKCVPFKSTRSLRNPWNRNLEIKVARDGQELETTVGMRLLKMFE